MTVATARENGKEDHWGRLRQNLWDANQNQKEITDLAGMKAEIVKLKKLVQNNTRSSEDKITCFNCNEDGHYSNRCPKLNNKNRTKNKNNDSTSNKSKGWRKEGPKGGEKKFKRKRIDPTRGVTSVNSGLQVIRCIPLKNIDQKGLPMTLKTRKLIHQEKMDQVVLLE